MMGNYRNFLFITIAELIEFSSNFLIIYLITKIYTPDSFALYSITNSFIAFFLIIANFGIGSTIIKFLTEKKKSSYSEINKVVSTSFRIVFFISLIISILLFLNSDLLENIYDMNGLSGVIKFAALYFLLFNLVTFFEYLSIGLWMLKIYMVSKLFSSSFRLIILLISTNIKISIQEIFLLFFIIVSIQFLIILIVQTRKGLKIDIFKKYNFTINIFKFSIYIFLPEFLLFIITNFNQFILASFVSENIFSQFSLTLTIIQALSLPVMIFGKFVYPYASYFMERNKQKIRKLFNDVFYYGLLLMIPLTMYVFCFADSLILSIFGSEYINAITYSRIFVFYLNFKMLDVVGGHFLWAAGKVNIVFKLYFVSAISTLILSLILIPIYFSYGAIISIIIPHIFYIIYTLVLVKRVNEIKLVRKIKIQIFKILLTSTISLLISEIFRITMEQFFLEIINLIISSTIYLFLYILLNIITKTFSLKDIKKLVFNLKSDYTAKRK